MTPVNEIWENCYEDGWAGLIVPEAFSHPAKMARGLLTRILDHAEEQGWIDRESIILDPFGGIGSTGLLGAYRGHQVICVELEQKFVDLAGQNFELHRKKWEKLGYPQPVIIQGDSRQLCKALSECDFIISSPPYAETLKGDGTQNETAAESRAKRRTEGVSLGQSQRTQGYGSKGNLGNLKPGSLIISSPPYGDAVSEKHGGKDPHPEMAGGSAKISLGYSKSEYNLGNMKAIISSPPFENYTHSDNNFQAPHDSTRLMVKGKSYGNTEGNIGQEQGETFWSAARQIVSECHKVLRPGGVAVWVVKSFVRNKKIVDFPGDWRRLCESEGFETICEHKSMLVKEVKQKTLFGHTETKRKERKSFFRRLAESKGSPRIDFENVICMRARPDAAL